MPAVFTVTSLADAGAGSLRAAVSLANSLPGADAIRFASGVTGQIRLTSGQIDVRDHLTIQGPGAADLAVNGNQASRIFSIDDSDNNSAVDVEITGLRMIGGSAGGVIGGGAVFNAESLTLDGVIISGSSAFQGGGLFNSPAGTVVLANSVVSSNSSEFDGGGIKNNGGSLFVRDSTIAGNRAQTAGFANGGGIASQGTLELTRCVVEQNAAGASGGGVDFLFGGGTITDCIIRNNTAAEQGGGVRNFAGNLTISNTTIEVNTADDGSNQGVGAAIHNDVAATLTVSGSDIQNNDARSDGAGMNNLGALTVVNSEVSNNDSLDDGGGISNRGSATIIDSNIRGNRADDKGGGVRNVAGGSLTIRGSLLAGNIAHSSGGGIDNTGTATVVDSVLLLNETDSTGGGVSNRAGGEVTLSRTTISFNTSDLAGGGLFNAGTDAVTDCFFNANHAELFGGGIHNQGGAANVTNSTVRFNTSTEGAGISNSATGLFTLTNSSLGNNSADARGGAIQNSGTFAINNCTLSNNRVDAIGDGSLHNLSGTVTLNNSIVANSFAGILGDRADVDVVNVGGTLQGSHNLIERINSVGWLTNTIVADPQLGHLQDNGGLTLTFTLLGGSPAINAGNNALVPAGVTTDQRGLTRFVGAVDIGAFEVQSRVVVPNVTKDDGDWGFQTRGTWALDTSAGFQGDHRVHPFGAPQGADIYAGWTFQQPLGPGNYELFASWVARPTNATNATYRVFDGNTLIGTVVVNQRVVPTDALVGATPVASLGVFHTNTGVFRVELSSVANGDVVADAVFDPPVGGPEAVVRDHVIAASTGLAALDAALSEQTPARRRFVPSIAPREVKSPDARAILDGLFAGRMWKRRGAAPGPTSDSAPAILN